MNFKEYINEKYFNSFKVHPKVTVEVFKNPTSSEFKSKMDIIGFLDEKDNLFIWDLTSDYAHHTNLLQKLNLNNTYAIPIYINKNRIDIGDWEIGRTKWNWNLNKDRKKIYTILKNSKSIKKFLGEYKVYNYLGKIM